MFCWEYPKALEVHVIEIQVVAHLRSPFERLNKVDDEILLEGVGCFPNERSLSRIWESVIPDTGSPLSRIYSEYQI